MSKRSRYTTYVVNSFIRWLSGLKPSIGETYYFIKSLPWDSVDRIIYAYGRYRMDRVCPLCGKRCGSPQSFYKHLSASHTKKDIWMLLEPYLRE